MFTRLAFFVLLPTLMAGYYYFAMATKFYATRAEFVIQQADQPAGGLGGLFSGTGMATSQDSITVQSYLQSRDAMLRLDQELGFKAHFSQIKSTRCSGSNPAPPTKRPTSSTAAT